MLDLNSWVDLDEIVRAGVVIDEEFDRAGVFVLHRAADRQGGLADFAAQCGIEVGRRGDFDDLLMPPLHRAVPLEQMDKIAVLVAEKLHFDVPRAGDEFFDEDFVAAEGVERFALGLFEVVRQLAGLQHHAHAAPAATLGRFEHDRIAELGGDFRGFVQAADGAEAAGEDRHLGLFGDFARGRFVAELLERLDFRADERHARRFARAGQFRILGQKAIAGVDRIDVVLAADGDQIFDVEIRADRFARLANLVRLVGLEAVQGVPVLVRIDRDRADAQLMGGAEHADGDFAAVGHHQLANRLHGTRRDRHLGTTGSSLRPLYRTPAAKSRQSLALARRAS